MKSKLIALATLLLMSVCAFAQNITVQGNVTSDEDGLPIIGASVLVVGTTTGTITDIDGNFTIQNVPQGADLTISYVGMHQQTVKAQPQLTIVLKSDSEMLGEVVVTAMGIQRQAKAIGYSTAKVDADELTAAKGTDATTALSGKVSGLEINVTSSALDQETRIQLRGARSFKGDNSALLVLDGAQTPMSFLQTLNPNDIDNVSVLKGASAAALYGSEAANGVIIVTTKSGSKGKPQITYGFTVTTHQVSYLPKTQHRFGSGHRNSSTGNWDYTNNSYMSYENQQFGPEFDNLPAESGWPLEGLDGAVRTINYGYVGDDYLSSYYRSGLDLQHDVSYSSSDDRGSMYLSYQRLDQQSITRGDESARQTLRFNASRNYNRLNVSGRATYTHSTYDMSTYSSSGIYSLMQTPANYRIGDYVDWRQGDTGSGVSPNEYFSDYSENPFFLLDTHRRETRQDRLAGTIQADLEATNWLKFTARAGLNLNVNNTNLHTEAFNYSEYAKQYKYNASSDQVSTFTTASSLSSNFNLDLMAMANHKFGEDFELKGMVGYSLQDKYYEYKRVGASQLAIPNLYNLANKLGDLTGSNKWTRSRKTGIYASVDLSYRNWAFLQLTGRNDWTSLLAKGNRSFFYPSANASVVLTDAMPSLKSDIFNHWKMRASWARVGTVNLEPYKLQTLATVSGAFPYGTTTGYALSTTIYSNDLKPEFTSEYEVGTEFGFFNNRITLEAAAYIQRTTDQTVPVSVPTSTGYASRYINAGTMEGKGVELDMHINPIVRWGDFSFNLGFNATFVKTKVVELADGLDELAIDNDINGTYYGIWAIKGESFPVIKAQDWKRDDQGRVIVNATTGLPEAGDMVVMGTTEPTVRLGITPTFRYKDWTLTATVDYRGGHKFLSTLESSNCFTGASWISATAGRQRVVFPHSSVWDDATQSYVDNENITIMYGDDSFWNGLYRQSYANLVYSAATWRLREVSLNYEFPKKLIDKIGFVQGISASLVGRNLLMFRPKTNIFGDPEFSSNGGNSNITSTSYNRNANGTQGNLASGYRSYGFNLIVTF